MIEEKHGYYLVTGEGKKEFALHSTASISNSIMIILGIAIVGFTFSLELEILPKESVVFFGIALIVIGSIFLVVESKKQTAAVV